MPQSKKHHWWPVALQSYWADKSGDVSWIRPDGSKDKKRYKNRNIGAKRHGHTMHRGAGPWETNFEPEFTIDDEIHRIIQKLKSLRPAGFEASDWITFAKKALAKTISLSDLCRQYTFEEDFHRELLLLIHSLAIRSPCNRYCYENYPTQFGMPVNENVGKANMYQQYQYARRLCKNGYLPIDAFVILHSPVKRFIFGDGQLHSLTTTLTANRISGKALLPLTPDLCLYFCTKSMGKPIGNVASMIAPTWMVESINEITQIYSRDFLFFKGRPPVLRQEFRDARFYQIRHHSNHLIDTLDEIVGNKPAEFYGIGTW